MNQYFFILGKNVTLSTAEIVSLIDTNLATNNTNNIREISGGSVKIRELSEEFLILETKEKLDVQKLQERLGGTIKIGEVISRINTNFIANNTNIIHEICDLLVQISKKSKKVYFGFSFYGNGDYLFRRSKKWAMEIKNQLKEKNIPSRWVTSKEKNLSSVIIQKNKLLTQGAEFVFLFGTQINADQISADQRGKNQRGSALVGRTLTCQQFEEYSERDYGRPARKIEEGMLPPKLAKIMINLSRISLYKKHTDSPGHIRIPRLRLRSEEGYARPKAKFAYTILDPFCGSGTILQEAVLLDYQNIYGSDINEEAIKNTRQNLKWLAAKIKDKKQKIKNIIKNLKIFKCNVKNLSKKIPPNSINAIVTEPYLGPVKISNIKNLRPRRIRLWRKISKIISELSNLYLDAFREFKKVLKPSGCVVIIFPIFKVNGKLHFLPILDELKKIGWQVINPIPAELRKNPVIKTINRGSIIYSRPDQTVLREIFIFKLDY